YLVLPFIIWYVKPSRMPYLLLVVILSAPVLRTLLYLYYPYGKYAAYILMPCRADALMLGVCAAILVRSPVGWNYLIKHRRLVNIIFGILFVGVFWAGHKKWMVVDTLQMSSIGHTWIAFFYLFMLLVAISQPEHFISRILRTRALVRVGIIAYGLYLFHFPVLGLCYAAFRGHIPQPSDLGDALTTALAFILILVLAQLSWSYFEKPMVKLGHKYKYRGTEEAESAKR
ncbi:MAG: acyltransferase, partial [Pyrinomonadaceae bacterium]|nr:acyltransferase [Pyrinomonadaceae bacterium]